MRAFISINLPKEVSKELIRIQNLLPDFKGKMTEHFHLTLKFLGEIDDKQLNYVQKELQKIGFEPINTELGKSGTFPKKGKPRIVWIEIKGINELQKRIESTLKIFSKDRFQSHVTIARIKSSEEGFSQKVKKIEINPTRFTIRSFSLMKSILKSSGPVYTVIENFS